jgi:hypothetical protein
MKRTSRLNANAPLTVGPGRENPVTLVYLAAHRKSARAFSYNLFKVGNLAGDATLCCNSKKREGRQLMRMGGGFEGKVI